ncbi:MAG TPA: universal stress protein [Thermodesulfobacteriota bacterium]|nr:universal stress protein [Thermodesulfobacteriota bacterium]
MLKIGKILWPTDGSEEAISALNYARSLAKGFNSEITGLHVIEIVSRKILSFAGDKIDVDEWVRDSTSKWVGTFDKIQEELKREGFKFTYKVTASAADEEIIRVANEEKVDLIVMGKRGLGLVDRVLIGSTALRVLRESGMPVLIAKKRDRGGEINIRNILVPFDIFEGTDSALLYAINMAEKMKASISALYVFWLVNHDYEIPPTVLSEDLMSVVEHIKKVSSGKLEKRVREIKLKSAAPEREINTKVLPGMNSAVSIIDYASGNDIDLIVIHTHGRKGFQKFMLGSVTEKIIQELPCAVLTLKP